MTERLFCVYEGIFSEQGIALGHIFGPGYLSYYGILVIAIVYFISIYHKTGIICMAEGLSLYIFGSGQYPRAYFRTRVFIILGCISNSVFH